MDSLIDLVLNISVWSVVKGMIIFALAIYLVFSFVVVRQVTMMTKVVSGELNWAVKLISLIHFLFSAFVILLAFLIL